MQASCGICIRDNLAVQGIKHSYGKKIVWILWKLMILEEINFLI